MISLGKPELVEKLKQRIRASGPLPFDEFMREALYAPALGYYTSGDRPVGRQGDFYTSVSVGRLFGKLLAGQFVEVWEKMGKPSPFHLVEQGGHHGQLAHDILSTLHEKYPETARSFRYVLIEPSDPLALAQKKMLQDSLFAAQVEWLASPEFGRGSNWEGVYFSNELPDSFPVHLVAFKDGQWREKGVAWNESLSAFEWIFFPELSPALAEEIRHGSLPEIENYTTELCLEIRPWMTSIHQLFSRAIWLTIDYGWTAEEYFNPSRNEGTLLCYSKHHASGDPLHLVGEQDITAHVNFSLLMESGRELGMETLGLLDQHHAMVGLASETLLKECSECELTPERMKELRAFQSLSHPEIMGRSFSFLVQAQGWKNAPDFSVLKFARKSAA